MDDFPLLSPPSKEQIENKRDWVITSAGKVVRRDKAKTGDKVPDILTMIGSDSWQGPYNSFASKEDAYTTRDYIVEKVPNAFLVDEKPRKKPGPKPKARAVEQDEFRELLRAQLMERLDDFWENWEKLRPEDKCSTYKGLLLFAYSKAPNERVLDPLAAKSKKDESKRAAAAEAIANGLHATEDTDFEE